MIAALFVDPRGVYSGMPDVDCWGEERDARLYPGPHPVVAHPPCARWGRYWNGGPSARTPRKLGDDDGCFAAAIESVQRWGGVLEHPEGSHAWRWYGLPAPQGNGGWQRGICGGWSCCVEQGWYGHRARKATWLYVYGVSDLPALRWGQAPGDFVRLGEGLHSADDVSRAIKTGACQRLSKKQRAATPPEFRDVLLEIARSVTLTAAGQAP